MGKNAKDNVDKLAELLRKDREWVKDQMDKCPECGSGQGQHYNSCSKAKK